MFSIIQNRESSVCLGFSPALIIPRRARFTLLLFRRGVFLAGLSVEEQDLSIIAGGPADRENTLPYFSRIQKKNYFPFPDRKYYMCVEQLASFGGKGEKKSSHGCQRDVEGKNVSSRVKQFF